MASTLVVVAAVLRNLDLPGIWLVVLGAICNMAAIASNGGYMPATPEALASLGKTAPTIYSNSAVVASPNLPWLIDRFALPRGLPFANVFSVGDVLLATGVFVLLVVVMRRGRRAAGPTALDERRAGLKSPVTAPDPTLRTGAARQLPHLPQVTRTFVPCPAGDEPPMVGREGQALLHRLTVQGKPVARRGRKARDLPRKTARLPGNDDPTDSKESDVKGNLVRLTWALALVASLALTIGAGLRWY